MWPVYCYLIEQQLTEYIPVRCPKHGDEPCSVNKKGSFDRTKCFDVMYPVLLTVPGFYCYTHHTRFSVFHDLKEIPSNLVLTVDRKPVSFVVMDRTILVCTVRCSAHQTDPTTIQAYCAAVF